MSIKYWEFEDAPLREKLKNPSVKDIAKVFFESETEAYRFSALLLETKRKGQLRLRDVPKDIPIATAKRYLDYAVQVGLLKHEDNYYMLTDRYTRPFKNIATYIKEWMGSKTDEDLGIEFANARTGRQTKRGGRKASLANATETISEETEIRPDDNDNQPS
ncbi:MAG: hypothetical protein ACP5MZ_00560 [Candidatus Micrarchaeia archaeon]